MAPSIPLVAALFRIADASLDEQSMLQMPMLDQSIAAEEDSSDCRCPGYFQEQCEENEFQGCRWTSEDLGQHRLGWTDRGNSNEPWCQCDPDYVPPGGPLHPAPPVAPPVIPQPAPTLPPPPPAPAQAPAAECPAGWEQKGEIGADIGGCGLQSCGERYDIASAADCAARCDGNSACVGFSFSPMNGDRNHPGVTACTIYNSDTPTGTWTGTEGIATQVMCGRPTLRINGGTATRGRLELLHNGEWGSICDDSFDMRDAQVACRQMGFECAIHAIQAFGGGSGQIWLDDMGCNGAEDQIQDCPNRGAFGSHNCQHSEDVGVECSNEPLPPVELRIAGGTANRGRLEILYNGEWGTVCDDDFDMNDAQVACRQMGFSSATAAIQQFGGGSGNIWLDDMLCSGAEADISHCPTRGGFGSHNCQHSEDAGVECA